MNRADLIGMVKNHGWSGETDSSELKELISLYPWFQTVYTLLLDAQYSSDSISFEESLKKNAVFVANREVLYYILKETGESTTLADTGLRSREELVEQIESRLAELEKESAEKAIDSSEEQASEGGIAIAVEEEKEANGILVLDEEEDIVPGFDDTREIRTEAANDLLDLDYPEIEDARRKTQDEEDIELEEHKEESRSADELIDRFIDLNPRIQPDRAKMEEPIEDIAEKVEDKDPGLITETLARIYINQKFYTRAILIYEKLSLKFPEKSSYFATQIEKIKELMS